MSEAIPATVDQFCGDYPAPCNCNDPLTHDGRVPEDIAIVVAFKAECDKVGLPYDPAALVRHHRGNERLTQEVNRMSMELLLRQAHGLLTHSEVHRSFGAPERWRTDRTKWFKNAEPFTSGGYARD